MVHPLQIGKVSLANNVFLAPMAGITDRSFRQICREKGCGLTYSEMVSGKSILYRNFKDLLDNCERPWAVQLFGREPAILAEAAQRLEDICPSVDIIDLNMGCPAPKIVKNGEGSALMKEPRLAGQIIEKVARAVNKPVTVKMRKGFSAEDTGALELAKIAQESGAAAVTIHGRTRVQFYSGQADWDIIAQVKQRLRIPVIGNGDVDSAEKAEALLAHTQCDGIMVARGALGNPWIFGQIIAGEAPPGPAEKVETALKHGRMAIAHKGERTAVLEMRKHLSWYIKGVPSAAKLRVQINKASTYAEMEAVLRQIL